MTKLLPLLLGALCAASPALAVSFETLTVDGTDAIYGAGLTGNGLSTAPVAISFTAGPGNEARFSSITGLTNCCNQTPDAGPDGTLYSFFAEPNTNITALNGISGILAPSQQFLAGVFIDSTNLPGTSPTPAALDYINGSLTLTQASYAPLLNQAFFIGDGLTGTGSGAQQSFAAPDSADTLLLGFIDGGAFQGTPRFYGDNPGALTVTGEILNTVPLPAGLPLLGAAVAGLALSRRRAR